MPPRSFDDIVADVHQPLLRYLLRRAPREVAADVLGDTLLTLWRRRADIPEGDPLPWSYGVARRCLANAVRGERRQHALVAKIILTDPPPSGTQSPPEGDPALDEALSRLGDDDRDILRLWAWEQLSAGEIAAVLDITPNAASLRLHRAKTRLRTHLADLTDPDARRTHTDAGKEEHP